MTEEEKKNIALFKYSIISPLISNVDRFVSDEEFFRVAEKGEYVNNKGEKLNFSATSIKRWFLIYRKRGFEGLYPKKRIDCGKPRKLDEDIVNKINESIEKYPRMKAADIYRILIREEPNSSKFSYYTVNRIYKKIKDTSNAPKVLKEMYRYECEYVNDVWCADSSAGPYLYIDNQKIRLWIIAFIDDASRTITACELFDSDNTNNLIGTLKKAVTKYGKPKVLNMDNGKNYRSHQMSIIAAKCGISLHYDPIKTPTSKAKIERFFKTLKEHWLASINYRDFKSISEYQASLNNYIVKYNNSIHSSLNGKTPFERRNVDLDKIIYIKENEIDNKFMLEVRRKVSFDNIVILNNVEYKTPPKFANKSNMGIKYSYDCNKVFIVDDDGKEFELIINNKVDNSKIKRSRLTEVES